MEIWWLTRDLVAHWRSGGSLEMGWLRRCVMALDLWWLIGDCVTHGNKLANVGNVVAQKMCDGSEDVVSLGTYVVALKMLWLNVMW